MWGKVTVCLLLAVGVLMLHLVSLLEAQPRDAGAKMRGEVGRATRSVGRATRSQSRVLPRASTPSTARGQSDETVGIDTAYSRIALPFEVGDTVVVARESARLMRGRRVLGSLPSGNQLRVVQIRGPWVGVVAPIAGRETGGWLWYSHVKAGSAETPE
jgi:hypothetical protein